MNFFEFVIHRFDSLVLNVGGFIYRHLYCIVECTVAALALAYIHASSDIFEKILAYMEFREPVLSEPPKNVTLWKFLGLNCLEEFVRENKAFVAIAVPVIFYLIYCASQPRFESSQTASSNRREYVSREKHQQPATTNSAGDTQVSGKVV